MKPTKGPIDRRVTRTRTTLHQALMSLTLEKCYDAVTVGDVCEAANVGRSTFYAHFPNKDALLRSGMDNLRDMLADRQRHSPAGSFGFTLAMLEHASSHRDLHGALAGGSAIAIDAVREILSDLLRNELAATDAKSDDAIPRELIVRYVVGAFMAVVGWWLDGGAKLPAERVDEMFRQLVSRGIMPARQSGPSGGEDHLRV